MYYLQTESGRNRGQRLVCCEPGEGFALAIDSSLALYRMRKERPEAYRRMRATWARGEVRSGVVYVLEGACAPFCFGGGLREFDKFVMIRYERFVESWSMDRRNRCSCPDALLVKEVQKTLQRMDEDGVSEVARDIVWAAAHTQQWLAPDMPLGLELEAAFEHWKTLIEGDLEDPASRSVPVPVLATLRMLDVPELAGLVERLTRHGQRELVRMEEQLSECKKREAEYEEQQGRPIFSLLEELWITGQSLDVDI